MASFVGGFRYADTPHGFAKREMLKSYLTSFLCQHLAQAISCGSAHEEHWAVCYIDAFAWRGKYRDADDEIAAAGSMAQAEQEIGNDEIANKGSPIVALAMGLKELNRYRAKHKETVGAYTVQNVFKAIHYVFNDIEMQNIENLKTIMQNEFQKSGFELVSDRADSDCRNVLLYQDGYGMESMDREPWYVQVTLVVGRFEDLEIPTDSNKTFSFIDPCGIKQIPLSTIERFIGP